MEWLFLEYPTCTTCKKARQYLQEKGVGFTARHIAQQNPTAQELAAWQQTSGLPLKRFFNTSGQVYRELHLSEKLPAMSAEEQLQLLASNGMLVKRPILVGQGVVLVGFRAAEWEAALS